MLMLAHRRMMDEDPVAFAIRGRVSQGCVALIAAIVPVGI